MAPTVQTAGPGILTDGMQTLSVSDTEAEFCPPKDTVPDPFNKIPRYLFRVYTPESSGSTDEYWTKSMNARCGGEQSNVDIFSWDRDEAAGMVNRHLRWKEGEKDNLISWTSSLLFAVVYIFHLHANPRDASPFDQIMLCIVDTSQFSSGLFLRDMDLIRAFSTFDSGLKEFEEIRSGRNYFGEYLSQGALKIEGKCRIVPAGHMFRQSLYVLLPQLRDFELRKQKKRLPPWANTVKDHRDVFYGEEQETRKEELEAAIKIAELFGGVWKLPVAANLLAFLPRDRNDPILLEGFRAFTFQGL